MRRLSAVLSAILICILLLSACTPKPDLPEEKVCRVVLSEGAHYTCEEAVKTVSRGGDAEFLLEMENGYTFGSSSYAESVVRVEDADAEGRRQVLLTLENVRYSTYVTVQTAKVGKQYRVELVPSEHSRCEISSLSAAAGESAEFVLWFQQDYTFGGVDWAYGFHAVGIDGEPDENGERRIVLTLENVFGAATVTVREKKVEPPGEIVLEPDPAYAVIGYALNGGHFLGEEEGSYYTINYPLAHYRRPNTEIGVDKIAREGYVLIGWNTRKDGGGSHIGTGSRADVRRGETLLLYAEWAKASEESLFDYVVIDGDGISALYREKADKPKKLQELAEHATGRDPCAVVTAYRGEEESLVIPESMGGYPTAVIARGTSWGNEHLKRLILPHTTRYVMEYAFYRTALNELYLYDSLVYLDYDAFGATNPIKTLHINAEAEPIYGTNESAQLANKLDLLSGAEGKKTVLFGSCSTWYSVSAEQFGAATGELTYNMSVEGDTCILFQLDLLSGYLGEGDTLLYFCDLGSPYLMLYDLLFDLRAFRMVEFDYDLLARLDMTDYRNVLSALNEYLLTKRLETANGKRGSYEDFLDYMTPFGDMGKVREGPTGPEYQYVPLSGQDLLVNDAFSKTKVQMERFLGMGLKVYYSFSPIRMWPNQEERIAELDRLITEQFAQNGIPVPMLMTPAEIVLPREYFYDTPYRLSDEGCRLFTEEIVGRYLAVSKSYGA